MPSRKTLAIGATVAVLGLIAGGWLLWRGQKTPVPATQLVELRADGRGGWEVNQYRPTQRDWLERQTADGAQCFLWLSDAAPGPGPNPGPGPTPPPGPNPPPNPPPVPDGRFGVAKIAYQAAREVNRPSEAAALAEAFDNAAAQVRAGLSGTLAIIKACQTEINQAIPAASKPAWESAKNALNGAVRNLYGDGKLAADNDWADAFAEIATGLKAAAR